MARRVPGRRASAGLVEKGLRAGGVLPGAEEARAVPGNLQIFGDKDAGFSNSHEYLGGMNYYPTNSVTAGSTCSSFTWTSRPSAARSAIT